MSEKDKDYDLEKRASKFARDVRSFAKKLPTNTANIEDIKQVVRSSGSIGANYIEANESISRKDFKHRIKICRKEAKETAYWVKLLVQNNNKKFRKEGKILHNEAIQLVKIFSSILNNS
ncbi:MAG: four helix bundle protein [Candidatus Magasanikbacteria bacterium]